MLQTNIAGQKISGYTLLGAWGGGGGGGGRGGGGTCIGLFLLILLMVAYVCYTL